MKTDRNQKQYIFICNGKDCIKNGARSMRKEFERVIKANKLKKDFRIVETRCMDRCKEGPSVVVDGSWYGKLTTEDAGQLLIKKAAK